MFKILKIDILCNHFTKIRKILSKMVTKNINFQNFKIFWFLAYNFLSKKSFTSLFGVILTVKVWPKFQKCHFLDKIHHGYGLFWSQSVGFGQVYFVPVRGGYARVCAGRCLFVSVEAYGAGPSSYRHQVQAGQFYSGPVILYIYCNVPFGSDRCRSSAGTAERSRELLNC